MGIISIQILFMNALKSWYGALLPIINQFDNVILIQVENEYSTNGGETEYIEELVQIVRESGIKAPIFHNDAYIAGLYSDVVDIYACDIYPYINPSKSWKESTFRFLIHLIILKMLFGNLIIHLLFL